MKICNFQVNLKNRKCSMKTSCHHFLCSHTFGANKKSHISVPLKRRKKKLRGMLEGKKETMKEKQRTAESRDKFNFAKVQLTFSFIVIGFHDLGLKKRCQNQ